MEQTELVSWEPAGREVTSSQWPDRALLAPFYLFSQCCARCAKPILNRVCICTPHLLWTTSATLRFLHAQASRKFMEAVISACNLNTQFTVFHWFIC